MSVVVVFRRRRQKYFPKIHSHWFGNMFGMIIEPYRKHRELPPSWNICQHNTNQKGTKIRGTHKKMTKPTFFRLVEFVKGQQKLIGFLFRHTNRISNHGVCFVWISVEISLGVGIFCLHFCTLYFEINENVCNEGKKIRPTTSRKSKDLRVFVAWWEKAKKDFFSTTKITTSS